MPLYQPADLNTPVLSQFSLKGKIALVTGGSGGIGRQVVTGLAEAGADVAFIYRTATDAHEIAAKIAEKTGVRVQAYQSDVTKRETIAHTIEQIATEFGRGRLDIVIANAGVCQNVPSLEYEEDTWNYMNSVNYEGVMWTAIAAGRIFKKQGRGNLIITASVSATLVNVPQTQAAYNSSKAGVLQLGKSLAVEWVDFARVNCVSPGYIMTEMLTRQPKDLLDKWLSMIPAGRVCNPEELKGTGGGAEELLIIATTSFAKVDGRLYSWYNTTQSYEQLYLFDLQHYAFYVRSTCADIEYFEHLVQEDPGAKIPAIGFGTFQDADSQIDAVSRALKAGCRLIDTARVYDVEKQVGQGIKESGVAREEVFVGTKLWCNNFHPDDVESALDDSLRDLDTPYVDLLMMHYPCTFARGEERFPRDADGKMISGETSFVDTWKAMEKLVKTGKTKAIGVSNFSKGEIQQLLDQCDTVPAVHQMEVHPYLQQKDFNAWLRGKGIHVVQFSPLGNMNDFYRKTGWSKEVSHMTRVTDQPILQELGKKYGKSPVQVVLAWAVNNGRSAIPKSVIDWQIQQNLEADFEMEPEDMEKIGGLDIKARFNDPSLDYRWRLYSDLEGIEGTVEGHTH
ncbi:hypothetical protein V502_01966 [Pseudogymnoascus sp. VKM F-4520 (FW-2644)]|nr:hypothetical protein V502_01966 [Pseudogymnoascus sp. VKM F-4520 (FW-2644)]